MFKQFAQRCALGITIALFTGAALAQTFPNKPVRLVIPYPAGAPVDNVARGLGEALSAIWGQPVLIDIRKAVADKAFLEKFVEPYGYDQIGETPQQFGDFLKRDSEMNAKRIKALGIKLD